MNYIFNRIISTLFGVIIFCAAQAQNDSIISNLNVVSDTTAAEPVDSITAKTKSIKNKEYRFKYFRVGVDVAKLLAVPFTKQYNTISLQADATFTKDVNLVIESGWANANTVTNAVSFKSNSIFIAGGFDKNFFSPTFKGDKDNAFIGLRLGAALKNQQLAEAVLLDPFYGSQMIQVPAQNKMMYWIGLTAGFRIEMRKNIFVGWNVRGKTFINPGNINELAPIYLAGYGNAEKKPAFDYNFYILYGFGKR